jgi:hypothetical protein
MLEKNVFIDQDDDLVINKQGYGPTSQFYLDLKISLLSLGSS